MERVFMNDGSNETLKQNQPTWNSSGFGVQLEPNLVNSGSVDLSGCNFNPNWENLIDHSDPFESALSSLVSSPGASFAAGGGSGDNVMIRELIGRLGSISNSGDVTPESNNGVNINASCCSTALNSPPKTNLLVMGQQIRDNLPVSGPHPHFPADFFRQTRRVGNSANLNNQFSSKQALKVGGSQVGVEENKEKSQLSSGKRLNRLLTLENAELSNSGEGSSVTEQIPHAQVNVKGQIDANGRIRKLPGARKRKGSPTVTDAKVAGKNYEPKEKISKVDVNEEANGTKSSGDGNQKHTKENLKPMEPPKDYIHVRARRGQATDSHSLAERVRREKIGERMKFLQDIVPGCNKVTGKAIMLDEIINYVQSLQRQVEFLSMKLSTLYPQRMDVNMEALLAKDIQFHGSLPNTNFPTSALSYGYHPQQAQLHRVVSNGTDTQFPGNPLNAAALGQNPTMLLPHLDGFGETSAQVSTFWENDLQSMIHMGLGQNQPQSFHSSEATTK